MTAIYDEKLKANTDCVYFLASPLNCKKGDDCEFRHSEAARLNPRDCWFWFAGKCKKSNCTFRHLPLDGLSTTTSTVRKHRVPCFYFGQGFCAKNEKCVFMHGLPPDVSTALPSEPKRPQNLSMPENIELIECTEKSSKIFGIVDSELPVKSEEGEMSGTICETLKDDAKISTSKTCLSAELQEDKVTDASSRMPATQARPRSHESVSGSNKSRQVTSVPDGNLNQVYPGVEGISVKLSSEEVLQRVHSPENRVYDCNESDELCKKTSFDVLVDDARTSQAAYFEDNSYLPAPYDVPMDWIRGSTQRGALQGQDLVSLYSEQNPSYYDYEAQNMYDPAEQHPAYYKTFNVGSQMSSTFKGSSLALNEQGNIAIEKKSFRTEDLRHHITKRRREERSLNLEGKYCPRQHGNFLRSDLQHHRRCHYDAPNFGHQERWIRGLNLSDGQGYDWQEFPRSWQNSGFCRSEFKQGWDHVASESGRGEGKCGFLKRLHYNQTQCLHVKGKMDNSCLAAELMNPVLYGESKGSPTQAKAEKIKCLQQHFNQLYGHQAPFIPKRTTHMSQTAGSTIGIVYHEKGPSKSPDFEGPKPLSVLLKEKGRRVSSAEVERCPKAARILSEGSCQGMSNHDITTPRNCELFRTPDLKGPNEFLKEKVNGVADCEVEDANSLELQSEVGIISSNGVLQVCKENAIHDMKDVNFVLNRNSDPIEENRLASEVKVHCLIKMDTNMSSVDTALSLSLSCSKREQI